MNTKNNPNIAKRRGMSYQQIVYRQNLIVDHFDQYAKRNYVENPFVGTTDLIHEEDNYEPWYCDDCLADVDYVVFYELDHESGRENEVAYFKLCRECALENWDYIRDFDK